MWRIKTRQKSSRTPLLPEVNLTLSVGHPGQRDSDFGYNASPFITRTRLILFKIPNIFLDSCQMFSHTIFYISVRAFIPICDIYLSLGWLTVSSTWAKECMSTSTAYSNPGMFSFPQEVISNFTLFNPLLSGLPHRGDGATLHTHLLSLYFPFSLNARTHTQTHINKPTRPCWGIHGLSLTKHNLVQRRGTNAAPLPRGTRWRRGARMRKNPLWHLSDGHHRQVGNWQGRLLSLRLPSRRAIGGLIDGAERHCEERRDECWGARGESSSDFSIGRSLPFCLLKFK